MINSPNFISELEENSFPKLKLSTVIGNALKNEELKISAAGLINSKRKARDGFTFFGVKSENEELNNKIDYELNISLNTSNSINNNNESNRSKHSPLIFMIYFNMDQYKYFIRACTNLSKNKKETELPYIIVQILKPYVRKMINIYYIK